MYIRGAGQGPVIPLDADDGGDRCGPVERNLAGMSGKLHFHKSASGKLTGPFQNVHGLARGICPSISGPPAAGAPPDPSHYPPRDRSRNGI